MLEEFQILYKNLPKDIVQTLDKLSNLDGRICSERKNGQNRSVKHIIGHMIDSASNNTHRIIHLQYQESPFDFPNYATNGNNDRWIAIQNYQDEDWNLLLSLWKYVHLHIVHVIKNIDKEKLDNLWMGGDDETVSLKEMVMDFPRHFYLHLSEIDELIN